MLNTEADLILSLKKGEEDAYKKLFYQYFEPLTFFANKYLEDIDLAKDMVQGVFSAIYEKREDLKINTSLKSYLYQSIANRSLNQIKSEKLHAEHHESIKHRSSDSFSEEPMEVLELETKIDAAIEKLPNQCQKIFRMSRFDHKTNQEIADELDLSKRTVETQISKALKNLRQALSLAILEFFLSFL